VYTVEQAHRILEVCLIGCFMSRLFLLNLFFFFAKSYQNGRVGHAVYPTPTPNPNPNPGPNSNPNPNSGPLPCQSKLVLVGSSQITRAAMTNFMSRWSFNPAPNPMHCRFVSLVCLFALSCLFVFSLSL
jgi:hypothetical protein